MTETNFTNEQLKVWASLGPWCQPDGPEYGVMLDRVPSRPIHGFLGQPIFDKQPHDDWFDQEMANAALIAAAPALASALLAERKAREVEVGDLKRTMFTVRVIAVDALFQPTFQRTALERISAELRAALEGPTP